MFARLISPPFLPLDPLRMWLLIAELTTIFAGAGIPGPTSSGGARPDRLQREQRPRLGGRTLRPLFRFRNFGSGYLRERIQRVCCIQRRRRVPELRGAADASAWPPITFDQRLASAPIADALGADEHRFFRFGLLLPHPALFRFQCFRQAAAASSAQEERHDSPLHPHSLTVNFFRPEFHRCKYHSGRNSGSLPSFLNKIFFTRFIGH